MGMFSWFRRASDPAADAEAASILTDLLDDKLTPQDARARWPRGRLSQPSAHSYIEYFETGLDGRGLRDPEVDKMVRSLVGVLERAAAASHQPAANKQ